MTTTPPVLLMTRPQAASETFVAALRERGVTGFEPVIAPLFEIVFAEALPPVADLRGLVFTSANGVAAWQALGGRRDLPVWAVGEATAAAAEAAGMSAQVAGGDADALVALLTRARPEGPLLHVRGRHARGRVAERLAAAGIAAREAVLYDQPERPLGPQARAALAGNRTVVVPVFSPRSAALLARQPVQAPLLVAAMSEAVAKALHTLHSWRILVAPRPDSPSMLDCVAELLDAAATQDARPGH